MSFINHCATYARFLQDPDALRISDAYGNRGNSMARTTTDYSRMSRFLTDSIREELNKNLDLEGEGEKNANLDDEETWLMMLVSCRRHYHRCRRRCLLSVT